MSPDGGKCKKRKEMSPDGKRARLAEAEMAAGLQDHLHLRDKTHLEMSRIRVMKTRPNGQDRSAS